MIPPLRQISPHRGLGRIAIFLNYRHGKYVHGCVQVIRHYRNRGCDDGGAVPERASQSISNDFP